MTTYRIQGQKNEFNTLGEAYTQAKTAQKIEQLIRKDGWVHISTICVVDCHGDVKDILNAAIKSSGTPTPKESLKFLIKFMGDYRPNQNKEGTEPYLYDSTFQLSTMLYDLYEKM